MMLHQQTIHVTAPSAINMHSQQTFQRSPFAIQELLGLNNNNNNSNNNNSDRYSYNYNRIFPGHGEHDIPRINSYFAAAAAVSAAGFNNGQCHGEISRRDIEGKFL